MSLTKLDPVTALVLIDLQKGILGMQAARPAGEVVSRAASLALRKSFRGWANVARRKTRCDC